MFQSKQVRQMFLQFMASKGHAIFPSSSLVPKEDPTVLFNSAGMQPLVPYLTGTPHPLGNRLTNSQKSFRTVDIDGIGDNRHCTFFEMLGSWSLGDYFKKESIEWGFEFLTSKSWLGLDPNRLYATVYKGYEDILEDTEAIEVWKKCFASVGIEATVGTEFDFKNNPEKTADQKYIYRITKKSGKDNWWGLPYRGPCGPCSEIYYLLDKNPTDFETKLFPSMNLEQIEKFIDDEIVEIWNHVFMEFEGEWGENNEPKNLKPLAKRNIDTGGGFERFLTAVNGLDTIYETDLLKPIVDVIKKYSK